MTITEHLSAQLARYCQSHHLEQSEPDLMVLQPIERQHQRWLERHIARCAAAKILDAYGLEVQSLLTAERARVVFPDGSRLLAMSRSGGALPTYTDWQISAFNPDGSEAFQTMSGGKLDLRAAIEAARALVDPGLESPCEVQA